MKSIETPQTIGEYLKEFREMQGKTAMHGHDNGNSSSPTALETLPTLKIALLSSFTINGLMETLFVKCRQNRILPELYVGNYNQCHQEILDKNSGLHKFAPDIIVIFMDTKTILEKHYLLPYKFSDEERKERVQQKLKEIIELISHAKKSFPAKIILHNFEVPPNSSLGILENKQSFGELESIRALNSEIQAHFKSDPQIFVFDYDNFCSRIGKDNVSDPKMYYLADIKLNPENFPKLCEEYLKYIIPACSLSKKCLVLDLDNTLWGGIIGEAGIDGIKLGPTPEGRPFLELQKYILSLFHRGIILAINSKNNPEDALKAIREHPYMLLKEAHFASIMINWNDKISNMKAVAKEINIGTDSLVFMDDDPLNREIVKGSMPEVKVVDMPSDPSLYLKTLMDLPDFNVMQITEEDKGKGKMYAEQRGRKQLEESCTDITEYLKNLGMTVTIEKANTFNIPRLSQLTQKTNQFNMTTKRYTEEEIAAMAKDSAYLLAAIKLEDKFGDNGLTGMAIVAKKEKEWLIDTFLLSCRVIGRRVEETLMAFIIEKAKAANVRHIVGQFAPTKKNAPAAQFYRQNGFSLIENKNGTETWQYDLENEYLSPDFINVYIIELT